MGIFMNVKKVFQDLTVINNHEILLKKPNLVGVCGIANNLLLIRLCLIGGSHIVKINDNFNQPLNINAD